MGASRRDFITGVARAGGYSAAYISMQALGLVPTEVGAQELKLAPGSGKGAKVVVLGAGLAGLSAAWELKKAGYDPVILEARDRTGGRNYTVRRGSVVEQTDGSRQICSFQDGQYFNAGPGRIPSNHRRVLNYCRELGVELEVEINMSKSALLHNPGANGGKAMTMRQVAGDTRGWVSELLAKAVKTGALDDEFSAEDRQRVQAFLIRYGALSSDGKFKGTTRSGFKIEPDAGAVGEKAVDPVSMKALLDLDMWNGLLFDEGIDYQATMFQPRGGMDMFPRAFEKALGPKIVKRRHEVTRISRTATGVAVAYKDLASGKDGLIEASYCLCTIPMPVLAKMSCDLSPAYAAAVKTMTVSEAIKIAYEAPRFWETDYDIYGGLGFTKGANSVVWYPSFGLHSKTGVLVGAYSSSRELAAMPQAEQIAYTTRVLNQMHPGCAPLLTKAVHVQWSKMQYSLGPWSAWAPGGAQYTLLSEPDGPIFFAGEHLSHIGAWQEGAIASAHRAVGQLDARHRAGRIAMTGAAA